MKKTYNNISFSDHDTGMGSKIKLLPVLLVILLIAALGAGGYFGYKFINALNNRVVSIEVTKLPDKVVYWVGQDMEYEGLEITATRKNGKTFVLDLADCEISGFTSESSVVKNFITVQYNGCETIFSVEISEKPKPNPVLKSITLTSLPKTEYKLGEKLSTSGGILLIEYKNGDPKYINLINNMVPGYYDIKSPGTYTLTVTYTDRELNQTATTTYTITVTE